MIYRVSLNISVLRLVAESPTFAVVKAATKKRGEDGKRAIEEFKRFEALVEAREFKVRLQGGASVMEPFSIVLHYSEGDSVPLSHVLPCFQIIYDFSQQMGDFEAITNFLDSEEERDEVAECVRRRWLGEGRRVGLKADVHLLAFVLDPFVQAALTSPQDPDCDLLDGDVLEGARAALRHFASDDHTKRSVLLQQFMLWNAAAPRLPNEGEGGIDASEPVAQATGNNAFSALRLSAMDQVWSKVQAHKDKMDKDTTSCDRDSSAFAVREEVAKLRLSSSPVDFWLAMMNEAPRGATQDQKQAHMLFCKSAADISSIVGHTCGVERAGKAYKQVITPHHTTPHHHTTTLHYLTPPHPIPTPPKPNPYHATPRTVTPHTVTAFELGASMSRGQVTIGLRAGHITHPRFRRDYMYLIALPGVSVADIICIIRRDCVWGMSQAASD